MIDQTTPEFIAQYAAWWGIPESDAAEMLRLSPLEFEGELTAAGWDESKHPRDPGGEGGGQFVEKGTAGWDDAQIEEERKWVEPPEPAESAEGRRAGGYTADDAFGTNTQLGRAGERAFVELTGGEILHAPGRGEQSPLDVRVDGYGFEVKTVSSRSTSFKATPKDFEAASKLAYADELGVEAALSIVVVDADTDEAYVYWRPGVKGGRLSERTGWRYLGKSRVQTPNRGLAAAATSGYLARHASMRARWREDLHPRHPAGTEKGGEFRPKDWVAVGWGRAKREFADWKEGMAKWYSEDEGFPPDYFENSADDLWERYRSGVQAQAMPMVERIEAAGIGGVVIEPQLNPQHGGDLDVLMDPDSQWSPDFDVSLSPTDPGGTRPGFTVWTHAGGDLEIEDVLDLTDTDFFPDGPDSKTAVDYSNLIDAVRGTTERGTVTIYRGMSDAEFDAWSGGDEIPIGKFFAGIPTTQYAQDISGAPPALYSFKVPRAMLMQTGPNEYQLKRKARLRRGELIQAAGYDESEHPRWPEGTELGGQWRPKEGGSTATEARLPKASALRAYLETAAVNDPNNFGIEGEQDIARIIRILDDWEYGLSAEDEAWLKTYLEENLDRGILSLDYGKHYLQKSIGWERQDARDVLKKLGSERVPEAVPRPRLPKVEPEPPPPPAPWGTQHPMDSVELGGGKNALAMVDAMKTIDETILFPQVPGYADKLRVKGVPGGGATNGRYWRDYAGKPDYIGIMSTATDPRGTITHEIGHHLDNLLGQEDWANLVDPERVKQLSAEYNKVAALHANAQTSEQRISLNNQMRSIQDQISAAKPRMRWNTFSSMQADGALKPVVDAIHQTRMYQGMRSPGRDVWGSTTFEYAGITYRPGRSHLKYLLKNNELLARSFEQYIVAKNPSSPTALEFRHLGRTGPMMGHMDADDLATVNAAWDKVLSDRGLLKKKGFPPPMTEVEKDVALGLRTPGEQVFADEPRAIPPWEKKP